MKKKMKKMGVWGGGRRVKGCRRKCPLSWVTFDAGEEAARGGCSAPIGRR